MAEPVGRPSDYCEEIVDEICTRLMDGESLRSILNDEHLPTRKTVYSWLHNNREFLNRYTEAREIQADTFVDDMCDIADDSTNDYMEKVSLSGEVKTVVDHENINRSRLRVDTRKYVAERFRPKKYFKPETLNEDDSIPPPISINIQVEDGRRTKSEPTAGDLPADAGEI